MKKSILAGGIAVAAVFGGVLYFAREPAEQSPPQPAAVTDPAAPQVTPPLASARVPVSRSPTSARPRPADPRLAALMGSPNDALIEVFADTQGRVIEEIDNDPHSAGYRRPLRQYTFAGDQVIRLVRYQYLGDQIQIVTADLTYKPDGSVDQYRETTRYQFGARNGG